MSTDIIGQGLDLNKPSAALELKNNIERNFIVLGKSLAVIRDSGSWREEYSDWHEFLADLKMSEGTVSKLVNLYKVFIVKYSFSPETLIGAGGWSTLAESLPHIKSKEDAEQMLHLASVHTREDFRKDIVEKRRGLLQGDCSHDWYEVNHRQCRMCGAREKTYEDK